MMTTTKPQWSPATKSRGICESCDCIAVASAGNLTTTINVNCSFSAVDVEAARWPAIAGQLALTGVLLSATALRQRLVDAVAVKLTKNELSVSPYNPITNVDFCTAFGSRLQHLLVDYNYVYAITKEQFAKCRALETIVMTHCGLTSIEADTFGSIENSLQVLNLSDNNLHMLVPGSLQLRRLQQLDLSWNKLSEIDENVLVGAQLEKLRLQQNALTSFTATCCPRLRELDLSYNQLADLEDLIFHTNDHRSSASTIQFLDLSANPLTRLAPPTLANLINLQLLRATNMSRLITVEHATFADCINLRVVDLSQNPRFVYLAPKLFNNTSSLSELNLTQSALMSIWIDEVAIPTLRVLRVAQNPLQCGCSTARLKMLNISNTDLRQAMCTEASGHIITVDELADRWRSGRLGKEDAGKGRCAPTVLLESRSVAEGDEYDGATVATALHEGDTLMSVCRGVGPAVQLSWQLQLAERDSFKRIHVDDYGTLTFPAVHSADNRSELSCNASNEFGSSDAVVRLMVEQRPAESHDASHNRTRLLHILGVTDTSIVLTWPHSRHRSNTMLLVYYQVEQEGDVEKWRNSWGSWSEGVHTAKLEAYMRTFSVHKLNASSHYRLCITNVAEGTAHRSAPLSCVDVRTRDPADLPPVIINYRATALAVLAAILLGFSATTALLCLLIRRYNRNQRRRDPFADQMSVRILTNSSTTLNSGHLSNAAYYDNDALTSSSRAVSRPSTRLGTDERIASWTSLNALNSKHPDQNASWAVWPATKCAPIGDELWWEGLTEDDHWPSSRLKRQVASRSSNYSRRSGWSHTSNGCDCAKRPDASARHAPNGTQTHRAGDASDSSGASAQDESQHAAPNTLSSDLDPPTGQTGFRRPSVAPLLPAGTDPAVQASPEAPSHTKSAHQPDQQHSSQSPQQSPLFPI